ncbi:hypothetical protein T11_1812, partial [Trichinella zimbabwensis]
LRKSPSEHPKCEKRLFRKFLRKSPSEHPKCEKRLFRKFLRKSPRNFCENRP